MSKYFNVNNPNNIVTITKDHGNFYQLSDGNMIKKDTFDSKYQPILAGFENEIVQEKSQQILNSEYIDPDSFFNSANIINNSEIDTLKNLNTNNIPDVSDTNRTSVVNKNITANQTQYNENIITPIDPKDVVIPNNTRTDVSQYRVFENDDDAYNDFLNKTQNDIIKPPTQKSTQIDIQSKIDEINNLFDDEKMVYGVEEATKRKTKRMNRLYNIPDTTMDIREQNAEINTQTQSQQPMQSFDPFTMMFSTFKRNHEIVFNIQFKDKIAKPEFIRMMMENMDGDIISYYKKIIIDNIKKDFSSIEKLIENELKNEIYGVVDDMGDIEVGNVEGANDVVDVVDEKPVTKKTTKKTTIKKTKID